MHKPPVPLPSELRDVELHATRDLHGERLQLNGVVTTCDGCIAEIASDGERYGAVVVSLGRLYHHAPFAASLNGYGTRARVELEACSSFGANLHPRVSDKQLACHNHRPNHEHTYHNSDWHLIDGQLWRLSDADIHGPGVLATVSDGVRPKESSE